jgi:transcriptional antiterminator RfaH
MGSIHRSESALNLRRGVPSIEVQEGLRWYVVETKPRQESQVDRRFRQAGIEVFLPWIRVRRRIGTKRLWITEPLFPGYVFCRIDLLQAGKLARYSPGVKDFVKFGSMIPEVSEEFIQELREHCPGGIATVSPEYRAGEPLVIREGPFSGLQAIFQHKMKDADRIAVLLEFLGRQTTIILPADIVEKA